MLDKGCRELTFFTNLCDSLSMIWVGLTGGIASGKSTVANILKEMGIPVVDADQLAHAALRHHQLKIVATFGPEILGSDQTIDRRKLGSKIFADPKLRKVLESLTHPYIRAQVAEQKKRLQASGVPLAVYDVPLLFESDLAKQFDHVLLVYSPAAVSVQRMMARNGLTQAEAQQRIANQMDIEKKKALADTVIDNQGDLLALRRQVEAWKNSLGV